MSYAIVHYHCPHCDHILGVSTPHMITIGSPVIPCPGCKKDVATRHIKEWEFMTASEKWAYLGLRFVWGMGLAVPLILAIALPTDMKFELALALYGVLSLLCFGLLLVFAFRTIGRSKERMKDPEYRKRLASFGFGAP